MPASLAPGAAALARVTFEGREAEGFRLIEAATREVLCRGQGQGLTFIHWALGIEVRSRALPGDGETAEAL